MEKKQFAFGKENFILLGISVVIIIIGFLLMSGAKTTEIDFNEAIFSSRRIKIAPIVTMTGFILVIYAILKKPKDTENKTEKNK